MDNALPRILVIASPQAEVGPFVERLAAGGEGLPALRVDTCGTAEEAQGLVHQAVLERRPYRLALFEVAGAAGSVPAVLERLRQQDSHLPILCVGDLPLPSENAGGDLRGLIVLRSPLDWADLRQWVRATLETAAARDERGKLAEQVEVLRREIETVREKADAAEEAKNEFMANVSHEIRTPLNAILDFSELLIREPLNQGQLEKLSYICDGGRELLRVIESLLDFSKLSAGTIKIKTTTFQVERLLSETIQRWQSAARGKGLRLSFHADASVPSCLDGDAGRLRQVLSSLVENAVKFTEQGSVHLEVVADEESTEGTVLRFTVSDTGPGIAPDRQMIVFDSFRQGDGSATRRFGGVGLGLAICRQLVALMGGQIGLRSTMGQGSSFWFTVPMVKQTGPGNESDPMDSRPVWLLRGPAVPDSHGKTTRTDLPESASKRPLVLVAAPDRLTRTMLEVILTRSGCVVQLTGTQEEVAGLLRQHPFALAFIEAVWLPGIASKMSEAGAGQTEALTPRGAIVGLLHTDEQPPEGAEADEWLARPIVYEVLYTLLHRRLSEPQASEKPQAKPSPCDPTGLAEWIERLGASLERWDFEGIEAQAQAVRAMAVEHGWPVVADSAMRVQLAARGSEPARTARAVATLRQAMGNPIPGPRDCSLTRT